MGVVPVGDFNDSLSSVRAHVKWPEQGWFWKDADRAAADLESEDRPCVPESQGEDTMIPGGMKIRSLFAWTTRQEFL